MMQHYQQPSPTPIWDEISRIQDSLSSNQMGRVDVSISTLFDDLKAMFQSLPLYPFDLGPLHGTVGKGEIRLSLPDNLFCNILFGNVQSVSIKVDDFLMLRDFLLAPNSHPE